MGKKIGRLARRYARALLAAIEGELGCSGKPTPAEQIARSLEQFAAVWKTDPRLSLFISSPKYPEGERLSALIKVAQIAGLPDVMLRFLRVLVENGRILALPEVAEAFSELADEAAGIVRVSITTARQIDNDEIREIENSLQSRITGEPVFTWKIDSRILGGMIISYSGNVIDGSLSGQLTNVEQVLTR